MTGTTGMTGMTGTTGTTAGTTARTARPAAVEAWHRVAAAKDPAMLDDLLADEVVFRSPAIFKPQEGKALTALYLRCAMTVLGPTLHYTDEWSHSDDDGSGRAVLEFSAEVEGMLVHGVDMIRWNADGRIVEFTVMVRPMRGLQGLMEQMAAALASAPQ